MRHAVVVVAAVIVCSRWKVPGERIDPRAGTDLVLARHLSWQIRIGTTRTKVTAGGATTGVTAKAAGVVFQSEEGMFEPGLADLFEPLGIICSAAHPIKILRDHWVIGVGNETNAMAGRRYYMKLLLPPAPTSELQSRSRVAPCLADRPQ